MLYENKESRFICSKDIFEVSPKKKFDYVYILNFDLKLLYASDLLLNRIGCEGNNADVDKSMPVFFSNIVFSRKQIMECKDVLETGKARFNSLGELLCQNGEKRLLQSSKYIITDADGVAKGVICIMREVTSDSGAVIECVGKDDASSYSGCEPESSEYSEPYGQMKKETIFMENASHALLLDIKVNLTSSKIEHLDIKDSKLFSGDDLRANSKSDAGTGLKEDSIADSKLDSSANSQAYSELINRIKMTAFSADDEIMLHRFLGISHLTDVYLRGNDWIFMEYRRADRGKIRWTRVSVSLLSDISKGNVCAFIYLGDVEKHMRFERMMPIMAEHNSKTHLYTKDTAEKMFNSMIANGADDERFYAIAMICIPGMNKSNYSADNRNGKHGVTGDTSEIASDFYYICRFLSVLLDRDCMLANYDTDTILVFCPDAVSDDVMCERMERVVELTKQFLGQISCGKLNEIICGISVENSRRADFKGMISQSDHLCELMKKKKTDNVISFNKYLESFKISEDSNGSYNWKIAPAEEFQRPLSGSEREVLSECMLLILSSNHYISCVKSIFGIIGEFYGADRVYSVFLTEDKNSISEHTEWVSDKLIKSNKRLDSFYVSGLPLSDPLISDKRAILIGSGISDKKSSPDDENDSLKYIVVPITDKEKVRGFLCIENPTSHTSEVAFPYTLIPIMVHERIRFRTNTCTLKAKGRDGLTGLPDRTTYDREMNVFNPDNYHSVGVFYINALNLRGLNVSRGTDYVDKMLIFVADTLKKNNRESKIYRISGANFAVITTNLMYTAFQKQNAFCREELEKKYPDIFNFGESWSDEGVSARLILDEAEIRSNELYTASSFGIVNKSLRATKNIDKIMKGFDEGKFLIYLQPQVDMSTGKLIGAEALARYRNDDGQIVLPGEFISFFEEAGKIKELDCFVMEKTFETLHKWKTMGYDTVPLSINFSKYTMMSEAVVTSLLEMKNRYNIPEDCVEIEVTESVESIDINYLRKVMDNIRKRGFNFALDDLGSEYSSLKILGELSFSTVKLDKSLIKNFLHNSMSRSVVESIVSACVKNNVKCLAEGVETELHVKELMNVGCFFAQGSFYGRPMPVEEFFNNYISI